MIYTVQKNNPVMEALNSQVSLDLNRLLFLLEICSPHVSEVRRVKATQQKIEIIRSHPW